MRQQDLPSDAYNNRGSISPLKERKIIEEQLANARGRLKFKKSTDVVAGSDNLTNMELLNNRGNVKRLLSEFMKLPN